MLLALLLASGLTAPAEPFTDQNDPTLKMYTVCISNAIEKGSFRRSSSLVTTKDGKAILFQCTGEPAKQIFLSMQKKGFPQRKMNSTFDRVLVLQHREPKNNSPTTQDFCIYTIQFQGRTADLYECMLSYNVGSNLVN